VIMLVSLRPRPGYPPARVTNHHEAIVSRGRLYVPAAVMITLPTLVGHGPAELAVEPHDPETATLLRLAPVRHIDIEIVLRETPDQVEMSVTSRRVRRLRRDCSRWALKFSL
jgi:hypothetical protein